MQGLNIDQFFTYKFLSGLRFSPDGKRAVFTVTVANKDENGYDAYLYLYQDGAVKRLTALGSEKGAFWEDDTHLLFPAVRTKEEQKRAGMGDFFTSYYRLDVTGGEAMPAFTLPVRTGELHAMEGGWYFTAFINSTTPDAYLDDADARKAARDEKKANEDYIVLEETPFYFNGDTFHNHRRMALFTYINGETKRLTAPCMSVSDAVLIDNKFYFVGREYGGFAARRAGLFCLDPATGETKELVQQDKGYFSRIKAYKGGLLLAFTEGRTYEYGEVPFFYYFDVKTGEMSLLQENELELGNSAGSDCRFGGGLNFKVVGEDVYFSATVRDRSNLYKMDKDCRTAALVDVIGSVDSFDVNEAGEVLMIGLQNGKLQELYKMEDGTWKRLTEFNEDQYKDRYIADYDHITVDSEGWNIDGWILKPMNFDPEKTYPAILDIHGGPRTIFSAVFFHEMQYWAGQGYFVFFCNPTGSDGQGDKLADITGEYGVHDYANIMDFTDAVLARYPQIDKTRLGVTGGSYGGFMTNWIIGHTDRFAAAATQRSISNWTSFYGTSDIGPWFGGYQNKATYTQN
ncbi:MAG: S9 family peptidase, partial [Lachnospiraceae bacterium]|nr:S9 family peptidase [Lachnospiraceae bacterium]